MENNKKHNPIALFGRVEVMVFAAFMCSLSAVMKLIAPSGDVWRISFENFPIIFSGMAFGPLIGLAVGAVSDLLGCVIRGYDINPLITVSSMFVGFIAGCVYRIFRKKEMFAVIAATFSSHMLCNVVMKTYVLSTWFGKPIPILFMERIPLYLITAAAEAILLVILFRNKAVKAGLKRVIGHEL